MNKIDTIRRFGESQLLPVGELAGSLKISGVERDSLNSEPELLLVREVMHRASWLIHYSNYAMVTLKYIGQCYGAAQLVTVMVLKGMNTCTAW